MFERLFERLDRLLWVALESPYFAIPLGTLAISAALYCLYVAAQLLFLDVGVRTLIGQIRALLA
ncbi:MAG TPA: hypothetical protein VKA31_11500 [Mariprofundaceae bacterium]|nr:hypothetical protein [Mariprofundaceae bacterium]